MMKTVELIERKIKEGKSILRELETMRRRNGAAINVVYYVTEDVDKFRKAIGKWQMTSKEILISGFGEIHRYVSSFERTITGKNSGFNYKKEFTYEVNQGLEILESISETMNMGLDNHKLETAEGVNKSPMVFISHSSNDKEFAEALVVLLEDIGFDSTNLFCSSVDGYGIGISQDIFETLRNLFNEHNLYVIFIHSPRYYKSPVSLNEMGAAWILKTDFCSFLTNDMDFSGMKGVVNSNAISIKVDGSDAPARLTELKDKLLQVFNLNNIDSTKWERKRQAFLDKVKTISHV